MGGSCIIRERDGVRRGEKFDGHCELLIDNPDGTTTCRILAAETKNDLPRWIDGTCDFPELRTEIG